MRSGERIKAVIITKSVALPNALLLVMCRRTGEPPRTMNRGSVAATGSCVAIGTLPDADGTTSFALSDGPESAADRRGMARAFDGLIATPLREVHLCSTANESLAKLRVPTTTTRVQIWTNHVAAPDRILVVVTAGDGSSKC